MRVVIVSRPKAGTYLCSEILANLNITQTYMHLSQKFYTQYDPAKLDDGRYWPQLFYKKVPLEHSVDLIDDNCFAVTHVDCTDQNVQLFNGFKKIALMRDVDSVIRSNERWVQETRRDIGAKKPSPYTRQRIENLAMWCDIDDTFTMQFDQMIGRDSDAIDNLQLFLFGSIQYDSADILDRSLNAHTLTKSSIRR